MSHDKVDTKDLVVTIVVILDKEREWEEIVQRDNAHPALKKSLTEKLNCLAKVRDALLNMATSDLLH